MVIFQCSFSKTKPISSALNESISHSPKPFFVYETPQSAKSNLHKTFSLKQMDPKFDRFNQ